MTVTEIQAAYKTMFPGYPDVVNVVQLSQMLDVSTKTVYKLLKNQEIQHKKSGRAYRIPKVHVISYCLSEKKQ